MKQHRTRILPRIVPPVFPDVEPANGVEIVMPDRLRSLRAGERNAEVALMPSSGHGHGHGSATFYELTPPLDPSRRHQGVVEHVREEELLIRSGCGCRKNSRVNLHFSLAAHDADAAWEHETLRPVGRPLHAVGTILSCRSGKGAKGDKEYFLNVKLEEMFDEDRGRIQHYLTRQSDLASCAPTPHDSADASFPPEDDGTCPGLPGDNHASRKGLSLRRFRFVR